MSKQIRVSPSWDKWWRVHKPWSQRDIIHTGTKVEAIKQAESIARNQKLETKIQNKNWKISGLNSYWNDPYPPKG